MTDLIVVPQAAHWQRLKRLVLDSVSSPITRRVYNLGLGEFFEWYGREPRPGFTTATVSAWRLALEAGAHSLGEMLAVRHRASKPPSRRTSNGASLRSDRGRPRQMRTPTPSRCT